MHEYYIDYAVNRGISTIFRTIQTLKSLATHIQYVKLSKTHSEAKPERVAETFMNSDDRDCKLYQALDVDIPCGECMYCRAADRGVCAVCGFCKYVRFSSDELKDTHKTREFPGRSKITTIAAMRAALHAADDAANEPNPVAL